MPGALRARGPWRGALAGAALLASACASKAATRVTTPLSVAPGVFRRVALRVDADAPGYEPEALRLAAAVWSRLQASRRFEAVVDHSANPTATADLGVAVRLLKVERVDAASRVMFGAMAGRASVLADVRVVDLGSRRTLGRATVEGKSSGGSVFAGTTEEAVERAADEIFLFVMGGG